MATTKGLNNLPEFKQAEINRIAEIIKEVVNPEMIILFGSYAKGTYVEHRYTGKDGIRYEYISDYDFLVVTQEKPDDVYKRESTIINKTDKYKIPVNLEIHGIDYVNKGLEIGEYFFSDIVKEGIILYNTGEVKFSKPRELTTAEKKKKALKYFNTWFPQSEKLIGGCKYFIEQNDLKNGVFLLHQATESLYYSILLVFTDYKPKLHNLWKLRNKAKPYSEELFFAFHPETDKHDEHLFDLLKRGYIDARYREDYEITEEEIKILIAKVSRMIPIVEKICKEKITSIE
jgi:predicted nucleotidyltransferase